MKSRYIGTRTSAITAAIILFSFVANTHAQTTIAKHDFDGTPLNLTSGFNSSNNLNGGFGDYFGIGNLSSWPQGFPPGVPFSIADDSVVSVSNPANAAFPTDTEAVYGQNASFTNNFFAISDTREWTGVSGATPLTASWTFDISSAGTDPMKLSIDLGQQSEGSSFGGITSASFLVEYSIDAGPFVTAMSVSPNAVTAGFQYRAMDSGTVPTTASAMLATAPSANPVTKFSAETGLAVSNTFLDKTASAGSNAGKLDSFVVDLTGSGNSIQIRITCFVDFEAMVFDNIKIVVDEPAFVLGDANGDGNFDFGDIEAFFLAITDPDAYAALYPNIDPNLVLDFDGDMSASFGDIEGFFNALTGG